MITSNELDANPRLHLPKLNEHFRKQSEQLSLTAPKISEFNSKLDALQEHLYGTLGTLKKCDYPDHKMLWLVAIKHLLGPINRYVSYFDQNLAVFAADETLCHMTDAIGGKINSILSDFAHVHRKFAQLSTVADYRAVLDYYFDVLESSMELVALEKVNIYPLRSYEKVVCGYLKEIEVHRTSFCHFLPCLVSFLRACYETGNSQLTARLIGEAKGGIFTFSPFFSLQFVLSLLRKSSVNFVDLLSFWRFTAFNLVALSLSTPYISDSFNSAANVYFKILLSLPNLSPSLYEQGQKVLPEKFGVYDFQRHENRSKAEQSIVSLAQRQELSLMFLINYMLGITSLKQVARPSTYFSTELNFLSSSFAHTLSEEIDRSASQSTHSSTASFAHLQAVELQRRLDTMCEQKKIARMCSLSSILYYGSYKEKVRLVSQFVEVLGNMNGEYFRDLAQHESHSPGKNAYIDALGRIGRLYHLVSLKFCTVDAGVNDIPSSKLNIDLHSVLSVKHLMDAEMRGDAVRLRVSEVGCSENSVERMVEMVGCLKEMRAL